MPFTIDPEFWTAFAPLIPILSSKPKPEAHDIASRREGLLTLFNDLLVPPPLPSDMKVTDHTCNSQDNKAVAIRRFLPKAAQDTDKPVSAVLHIHGGGLIAGSVDGFNNRIAAEANDAGVQYFSVSYRLAPENPAPAGLEDCYAALAWLSQNASSLNVDPTRIVVAGESAGGNLALATCLLARDRGLTPPVAKQILIYPMLDDKNTTADPALEATATWNSVDNITGWTAYLGADKVGKADVSPYYVPARADVKDLPPTYLDVGTMDIFRDENLELVRKLYAAGVDTELHVYPGVPHAFTAFAPEANVSNMAKRNRTRAVQTV